MIVFHIHFRLYVEFCGGRIVSMGNSGRANATDLIKSFQAGSMNATGGKMPNALPVYPTPDDVACLL